MNKEFKRIEVPLNWYEIDNIIVGLRLLRECGLMQKDFVDEYVKGL